MSHRPSSLRTRTRSAASAVVRAEDEGPDLLRHALEAVARAGDRHGGRELPAAGVTVNDVEANAVCPCPSFTCTETLWPRR